jgi:helicase MOV-10
MTCAPSNSAADLIAIMLSSLGKDKLFRFYAPSRPKVAVPQELHPFAYENESGYFSHPSLLVLEQYKVIVCTCVSAAFASGVGMTRGHFTHIFVDEAGQATEPETMVSIKTIADLATNVILSGDPKQLGPVIRSAVARELKLDISYLERLMDRETYQPDIGHGITYVFQACFEGIHTSTNSIMISSVVKLTRNYRSHRAILQFPNDRFYGGDLEPCGNPDVINSFLRSPILEHPTFPIVFHAISGEDMREASSPSFFNLEEVLLVKDYVERLKSDSQYLICTPLLHLQYQFVDEQQSSGRRNRRYYALSRAMRQDPCRPLY